MKYFTIIIWVIGFVYAPPSLAELKLKSGFSEYGVAVGGKELAETAIMPEDAGKAMLEFYHADSSARKKAFAPGAEKRLEELQKRALELGAEWDRLRDSVNSWDVHRLEKSARMKVLEGEVEQAAKSFLETKRPNVRLAGKGRGKAGLVGAAVAAAMAVQLAGGSGKAEASELKPFNLPSDSEPEVRSDVSISELGDK